MDYHFLTDFKDLRISQLFLKQLSLQKFKRKNLQVSISAYCFIVQYRSLGLIGGLFGYEQYKRLGCTTIDKGPDD